MRQLNDAELKAFFEKLSKFIGQNIQFLIDRKDEPHVFRLIKDRVYYMSESLMKISSTFARGNLLQ